MADEIPDGGGRMPLPPEQPPPEPPELTGAGGADGDLDAEPRVDLGKGEPAELPPNMGHVDGPPSGASGDVDLDNASAPGGEWWRGDDVRSELGEDWHSASTEAGVAAHELSHQLQQAAGTISDAVAGVAYPAAAKRQLDIRWMRLSLNIPAIVLALLATYGGRTATDRMVHTIATDGPFAPLGIVLFFVLAGGLLLLTPIGTPLAQALAHVVTAVAQGLVSLVRRAWSAPVTGYLMRLVLAVLAWAFVFAVVRVGGREILHWLTGV